MVGNHQVVPGSTFMTQKVCRRTSAKNASMASARTELAACIEHTRSTAAPSYVFDLAGGIGVFAQDHTIDKPHDHD